MAGQRGGARRSGTTPKTLEKFNKVLELLKSTEPKVTLKDALLRFKLPIATYYRLKDKNEEAG